MDDRFISRIRDLIYSWFNPLDDYAHPIIPDNWTGKFLRSVPGERKFTYLVPVYCIKHWGSYYFDHPDMQIDSEAALSPMYVEDEIKSLSSLVRHFEGDTNTGLMTWKFKDNTWNVGKGIITDEQFNPLVLAVCKTIIVNNTPRLMGVRLCIDPNVFCNKEYSSPWRSYICNYFIPACKGIVIDNDIFGLHGRKRYYHLRVEIMSLSQFVRIPQAPHVHVDITEVLSDLMKTHIEVVSRLSQ